MLLLSDPKYLQHILNAHNHVFYTDGIVPCSGHLTWMRDMCKRPTLFLNINLKTIDEIHLIGDKLLNDYPHIEQVLFDHTGDPIYNRNLSSNLNTWIKNKGVRGILASSEWTKKLHSDLIEVLFLNMIVQRKDLEQTFNLSNKKYLYSCLNRNPRWHRALFYTMLKQRNLLDNMIYTFHPYDPYHNKRIYSYTNKEDFGKYYKETIENMQDFPIVWPGDIPGANDLTTVHDAYSIAECNIVTETEVELEFTSEKIWKPIASGQCFHIVGSLGTNTWLRSLGFETFDNGYDTITDIITRLEHVADHLSTESMLTNINIEKIKHNQNHLSSGIVEKHILDRLVTVLDQ